LLLRAVGEDIEVLLQVAATGCTPILADRSQLEQAILNLAINARDAMPHGGTLTLKVTQTTMTDAAVQRQGDDAAHVGPYALLVVSDTGVGMDAPTSERIFEPFFTTKAVGQGTGLGLSMVHGVVRQSGGFIQVDSELGKGSLFRLYFPQATSTALRRSDSMAGRTPATKAARVLVVEDEAMVRRFACRYLNQLGYETIEAANGAEALQLLSDKGGAVDLVLTDVVMPVMAGRELAERVRERYPDLPLLFMSGYTDDEIVRRGLLEPGAPFLQKPFESHMLRRKVREMLAAGTEASAVSG